MQSAVQVESVAGASRARAQRIKSLRVQYNNTIIISRKVSFSASETDSKVSKKDKI